MRQGVFGADADVEVAFTGEQLQLGEGRDLMVETNSTLDRSLATA